LIQAKSRKKISNLKFNEVSLKNEPNQRLSTTNQALLACQSGSFSLF